MREQFEINGINGATGRYLLPSLTHHQMANVAIGQPGDPEELRELADWIDFYAPEERMRGPKAGVDPRLLSEAGWGVVVARDALADALREALAPLLELRRRQATRKSERLYRELIYRPGESKNRFLSRHGAGPGPADPEKLPYYLLLVGDPREIPFRFQYQLDVQYAVGRIYFETLEQYHDYARGVVAAETGELEVDRRAVLFGTRNVGDPATELSADYLVRPLAEQLRRDAWQIETCIAEQATKAQLGRFLGGDATPAVLFTACHGMGFPAGDERQLPHQGALLCQDWPGPAAWRGAIPADHYFAADDVDAGARPAGLIAFHFACYGAGTPRFDEFSHQALGDRRTIAEEAFLSRLPCRLLSHPGGGALAVIGHIERAWGCSFLWEGSGRQLAAFESVLTRLLDGEPIGFAMEFLNQRYAELSTDLSEELEELEEDDREADELLLSNLWTARNDARNYVVLGDPAARSPAAADALGTDPEPLELAAQSLQYEEIMR